MKTSKAWGVTGWSSYHLDRPCVTGQDYYVAFAWISGRPSLDFVGTLRWRREPEPHDYLGRPLDLANWALDSGLITEPMRITTAQLDTAREFREVIYHVVFSAAHGAAAREAEIAALNATAQRPPVELSLQTDGTVRRTGTASHLLSALARDALDLVGSDQIRLVRECDGPTCTRLYVDSSRARNRRWCSNSECGNRAKVAAFRHRATT